MPRVERAVHAETPKARRKSRASVRLYSARGGREGRREVGRAYFLRCASVRGSGRFDPERVAAECNARAERTQAQKSGDTAAELSIRRLHRRKARGTQRR